MARRPQVRIRAYRRWPARGGQRTSAAHLRPWRAAMACGARERPCVVRAACPSASRTRTPQASSWVSGACDAPRPTPALAETPTLLIHQRARRYLPALGPRLGVRNGRIAVSPAQGAYGRVLCRLCDSAARAAPRTKATVRPRRDAPRLGGSRRPWLAFAVVVAAVRSGAAVGPGPGIAMRRTGWSIDVAVG